MTSSSISFSLEEKEGKGVAFLMIQPKRVWVKNIKPIELEYRYDYAHSFYFFLISPYINHKQHIT